MIDKLITYIANIFNRELIEKIDSLKSEIDYVRESMIGLLIENSREYKHSYFRRGSCKGCLFSAKDEKLLQEGKCYCIFNPRPEIVSLKHKCGRIVKK